MRRPDPHWDDWTRAQREALREARGAKSKAIAVIDRYLAGEPPSDLLGEALAFRACFKEDLGDLAGAREDFVAAIPLSPPHGFQRFTVEISLGAIERAGGDTEAAVAWYIQALETVAEDPKTSGASALVRLLELWTERELPPPLRALAERVVRQGWVLFRLPGEPDLTDLRAAAETLLACEGRPRQSQRDG